MTRGITSSPLKVMALYAPYVTRHLDSNTKCQEVLFYYNFVNGIINK
jgi:hypothetical protein